MPYYIIFCKSTKEHATVKSLKRIVKKMGIDMDFRLQEKEMVNHSKTGKVTKKYNADICSELGIEVPEGYEAIAAAE